MPRATASVQATSILIVAKAVAENGRLWRTAPDIACAAMMVMTPMANGRSGDIHHDLRASSRWQRSAHRDGLRDVLGAEFATAANDWKAGKAPLRGGRSPRAGDATSAPRAPLPLSVGGVDRCADFQDFRPQGAELRYRHSPVVRRRWAPLRCRMVCGRPYTRAAIPPSAMTGLRTKLMPLGDAFMRSRRWPRAHNRPSSLREEQCHLGADAPAVRTLFGRVCQVPCAEAELGRLLAELDHLRHDEVDRYGPSLRLPVVRALGVQRERGRLGRRVGQERLEKRRGLLSIFIIPADRPDVIGQPASRPRADLLQRNPCDPSAPLVRGNVVVGDGQLKNRPDAPNQTAGCRFLRR